ncbi:MAG: beta-glucuronidase [Candidatus Aminicenantes bacterium]|nr:beta-glucuronidase [Candidatus Aminicenantes bacterium]
MSRFKTVSIFILFFLTLSFASSQQQVSEQTQPLVPRPEHPRPQFVRETWLNLNGEWSFTFDFGLSGKQRGFQNTDRFKRTILVPFCPESKLSGIEYKDFINAVWYQRNVTLPESWAGKIISLHFGAVDYASEVFVDGQSVGKHWGGTSSFDLDITPFVEPGSTHSLVVCAFDDVRSSVQPAGKQCPDFNSRGCHYTRTTGIWQTVWLEAVSPYGLKSCHIIPDIDQEKFTVIPRFFETKDDLNLRITVQKKKQTVQQDSFAASQGSPISIEISNPRLWSLEDPFLYELILEVLDQKGKVLDQVKSYVGMRKIHTKGNRIYLNNQPIYLRLVLDQGFYPEGIWTAPSDEALKKDILLSKKAGFNGARLHQKVFEERFHFWADRLGYLTWGESSSWGLDVTSGEAARNFLTEWSDIIVRDRNHPSIIAWTPFNETWRGGERLERLLTETYDLTKILDPTRPINDASGGIHIKTDLWTEHTYEQNPEKLQHLLAPSEEKKIWTRNSEQNSTYQGQPYLIDEYGGIKWIPSAQQQHSEDSWGYGDDPKTPEEFYTRLEALTDVILSLEHICGFCYTQLTDIEQEQNGIYNYDRTEKFDMDRIRQIISKQQIESEKTIY